jgi:HPt (histidine-containing phosphotransfer) domain-containing protein
MEVAHAVKLGSVMDKYAKVNAEPAAELRPAAVLAAEEAVGRLLGDRSLYLALLGVFCDRLPDDLAQIEATFSAGALQEARRLCHSLRGAAMTLGALRLAELAETSYQELEHGDRGILKELFLAIDDGIQKTREAAANLQLKDK